ncbi:MAG: hypothetical protein ACI80V_003641 [Rhodothermales bacterium]|jgi:hypothetical protein
MRLALSVLIVLAVSTSCASLSKEVVPDSEFTVDLAKALEEGRLTPVARTLTLLPDGERRGVAVDSVDETGLV